MGCDDAGSIFLILGPGETAAIEGDDADGIDEDEGIAETHEADNGDGGNDDNDPNLCIVDMVVANSGGDGVCVTKTGWLCSGDSMLAPIIRLMFQCFTYSIELKDLPIDSH
ncbi:hypothetical protein INT45_004239 [Circinella minor]|uniref:Uncharacterized protein n=1 Tax=Circinella minor TaxID=1195481 RepID=A0A8H7RS57_9FUNG|nr:hypothetical protein INT45_004239 [Circinella minor]